MSKWFYKELRERLLLTLDEGPKGRPISQHGSVALSTSISSTRDENQDRALLLEIRSDRFGSARLAVVCDGMGGLQQGGEAAAEALATFAASFTSLMRSPEDVRLSESLNRANWAVHNKYRGRSGTTLTALLKTENGHWSIHCGDSRLYGIDRSGKMTLLTSDDTLQNAINEHAGRISEDDLDNRLIQFVGVGEALEPHLEAYRSQAFEKWLLTTDGAHAIGRSSLDGIYKTSRNPTDFLRKLMYVADAVGTGDNATAICVETKEFGKISRKGLFVSVYTPKEGFEIWVPGSASENIEREIFDYFEKRLSARADDKRQEKQPDDKIKSESDVNLVKRISQEVLFEDSDPD